MIWEVDEDCDGFVDWDEFQKMYERCRNDVAGNEPRSLFNIALFAMHATTDHDNSSSCVIRADDLFKMVYFKVGSDGVETELNDVFQLHDVKSGRAVKIREFLTCLERQLVEQRQQMSTVSGGGGGGGKKNGNGSGVRVGKS
jgi:calmodulin